MGWVDIGNLSLGIFGGYLHEHPGGLFFVFRPHPVDGERCPESRLMEMAGCIGRELQDGRPAQAPVGDEQRALGAVLGAGYAYADMGNHHARKLGEWMTGQA